jgi:hypothetical protein
MIVGFPKAKKKLPGLLKQARTEIGIVPPYLVC